MALIGVTGGQDDTWPPATPAQGGPVKRYDVIIGGNRTTLLLSDADAAARGLTAQADPAPAPVETKAKAPANKARKPANKSRAAAVEAAFAPSGDTD